ncbi:type I restriction endonuclease subunit R [Actinoalloteichus hymeniacidonis]|uniref:Type I site-specific deoxyribonuclease n=1 Tax=Actinoalloteichus hymeniacidonis TaxID=340345 RepID=A0AAC9MZP3_9PSEU|nr:DEAD/DEAH box helicase family protein [Actinoalloteichus hymeniacidonis]AOS64171.1 type I site-specific deoxyribonuclease [Actinoalloteichus hymeniacidonis]MBB5907761.1 type I restriction enzyme R subunit [Actinoalloteichus hymeniacidonis]
MDDRLRDLAKGSPNFAVLYQHQPLLAVYGALAEATVFSNPNASLVQAGQFGEVLAEELITRIGIRVDGDRQIDRLAALVREGVLVSGIREDFDRLRRDRNVAAHRHLFDTTRALSAVRVCYKLGLWFHDATEGRRTVAEFVPPTDPAPGAHVTDPAELAELREALGFHRKALTDARTRLAESSTALEAERRARAEAENLIASADANKSRLLRQIEQLTTQVEALRTEQEAEYDAARRAPRKVDTVRRDAIISRAQRPAPLNEVQARTAIDKMLHAAGWAVQDRDRVNPRAAHGVAVREFGLATGRADYVLYVDGRIVGVIEAKREGDPLSSAVEQNDRYAAGVLKEHRLAVWREDEPFAFRYATTGTETYFINRLDPDARSRVVFWFHRPETIAAWMRRADESPATPTLRAALRTLPVLEENGLRLAQVDAITGLEDSLAKDRMRGLIQMATGAGKTFTAVAQTYRLLKHAGARRVLFLVDRNNLGKQAYDEFCKFTTPDDGRKLSDLYNINRLGPAGLQDTSSVVICTIQRMYSLLRGETLPDDETDAASTDQDTYETDQPIEVDYNEEVPIESFDLIVVDECHRSIFGLWRGVLEYFDAHMVGLTATPTVQALGFFGRNLVSEYTYPQAVGDGVNVDFDVVRMRTDLREAGGATIDAGTTVRVKDRKTRRQRYQELDDDFSYTTGQIGRSVVTVDEIRAVLVAYRDNWRRWFPGRSELPKTLIFAVGEDHAEDVLAQVKEVFSRGDDFAKKITYKSRQAGENPDDLIRALRTSPRLRVAITVDMIATGTDVKALECVIFLRDVRSAVLFEQMKGRGARTIDPTELQEVTPDADDSVRKTRFVLVDAVGVTESSLVDAKPLVPAGERQISLAKLLDKAGTASINVSEAEILAGRLARLNQQLTDEERDQLTKAAHGRTLSQIAGAIVTAADPDRQDRAQAEGGPAAARKLIEDAVAPLTKNPELRRHIIEIRRDKDYVFDEFTAVEVTEVAEIPREERAREQIDRWSRLLREERDRIAAVDLAVASPRSVSPGQAYDALKELAAEIRRPQYAWTPQVLWAYYEDLGASVAAGNRDADVPDLISLIRYELGVDQELRPYRASVEERFEAWLLRQQQAGAEFTPEQLWWLRSIRDVVASDVGISPAEFNAEPFKGKGSGLGFQRAFPERDVRSLLSELNRELA